MGIGVSGALVCGPMRHAAAAVAVMLVCLASAPRTSPAPAAASVAHPAVFSVTFVDAAPTPQPSGPVGPGPGPDDGKPGWVWLAAVGFVVLVGAGAVRFWLSQRASGHHWDASAP